MSDEPKCWWRYNNNGGRYKTCNYSQVGSKKQKKPKVPKKAMSPEAFVSMVGEDYSKMSKAEKNEYHRLDMAERRAEERILVRKNTKELIKIKMRPSSPKTNRKGWPCHNHRPRDGAIFHADTRGRSAHFTGRGIRLWRRYFYSGNGETCKNYRFSKENDHPCRI